MGSVIGDVLPLTVGVAAGRVAGVVVTATVVTIIADTVGLSTAGGDDPAWFGPPLGPSVPQCNMLAPAVRRDRRHIRRRGTGTAPEWNVRLKPWGGREDHDYGRNDQS
jgi:hypothetical protein